MFLKTTPNGFIRWRQYNYLGLKNSHSNTMPTVETVGYNKNSDKPFPFLKTTIASSILWENSYFEYFLWKKK
jgi:hypothetical protein